MKMVLSNHTTWIARVALNTTQKIPVSKMPRKFSDGKVVQPGHLLGSKVHLIHMIHPVILRQIELIQDSIKKQLNSRITIKTYLELPC